MGYFILIIAVLSLIIIILSVCFWRLTREISLLAEELRNFNEGKFRGALRIGIFHRPLEALYEYLNKSLEKLEQSRINAENHEIMLREQVANISHDFRTPLTAALGYLYMIKTTPEKTDEYLAIIEGRCKGLQQLVDEFYELSLLEDQYYELELEPIDATKMLTDCLLGNYSLFEEKGIRPITDLPQTAVMVMGNRGGMERVYQNLIQNALKHAQKYIEISLNSHGFFQISNDAENIPPQTAERLFERFYTVDRARPAGNTGLGLYIVKRLLEKMKGGINSVKVENGKFLIVIYFSEI